MKIKVGINGFGRMGRLALRAAFDWSDLEFIQINDPAGDAATFAHLTTFDSVHGRWHHDITSSDNKLFINGQTIHCTANKNIADTDWSKCDLVIEASGKFKTRQTLQAYIDQGVQRVVVTAPVKEVGVLNIVMGVNHQGYDKNKHQIVTAASCTTNSLAPIIKVLQENLGIVHGSITTIHSMTNTQNILDAPHNDLRRARACGISLIPTTTGSATAISHIFPELKGKLNGHAIRVPQANASLIDCVFEVSRATSIDEVNRYLQDSSEHDLKNILGYETRPLVSVDYKTDARSCIIDALSTLVIDDTQVKIYAWYDNEWGYVNRTVELVRMLGLQDKA